jgi:hypothetical protein
MFSSENNQCRLNEFCFESFKLELLEDYFWQMIFDLIIQLKKKSLKIKVKKFACFVYFLIYVHRDTQLVACFLTLNKKNFIHLYLTEQINLIKKGILKISLYKKGIEIKGMKLVDLQFQCMNIEKVVMILVLKILFGSCLFFSLSKTEK